MSAQIIIVGTCIAKALVQEMNDIEHHYIDITFEEKRLLNIDNRSLEMFSEFRFTKRNKNNDMLKRLRRRISDPVRECCWFAKLLDINIWPVLLICGEDHVENMRVLIQKVDRKSFVSAYHLAEYSEWQ